jgi:hypothetical protein
MGMHPRFRRFAAWLANFAILLAAFAPTVSHAMAAARGGASWVEICTTAGPAIVKLNGDQAPNAPKNAPASHLEHCPFCFPHAGAAGLPPAVAALPVTVGSYALPELFYRAPRPLFAWAAGQPRAPPAV